MDLVSLFMNANMLKSEKSKLISKPSGRTATSVEHDVIVHTERESVCVCVCEGFSFSQLSKFFYLNATERVYLKEYSLGACRST